MKDRPELAPESQAGSIPNLTPSLAEYRSFSQQVTLPDRRNSTTPPESNVAPNSANSGDSKPLPERSGQADKIEFFNRCGPDYIFDNHSAPTLDPTAKRRAYNSEAYDALNQSDRPAPSDLTQQEKDASEKLVGAVKNYYSGFDDKRFEKMPQEFNKIDPQSLDRVIDAANQMLKDSGLRIAQSPQSGEAWVGSKSASTNRYHIGALLRPEPCGTS